MIESVCCFCYPPVQTKTLSLITSTLLPSLHILCMLASPGDGETCFLLSLLCFNERTLFHAQVEHSILSFLYRGTRQSALPAASSAPCARGECCSCLHESACSGACAPYPSPPQTRYVSGHCCLLLRPCSPPHLLHGQCMLGRKRGRLRACVLVAAGALSAAAGASAIGGDDGGVVVVAAAAAFSLHGYCRRVQVPLARASEASNEDTRPFDLLVLSMDPSAQSSTSQRVVTQVFPLACGVEGCSWGAFAGTPRCRHLQHNVLKMQRVS
eukprot:693434-Pelagomonas_calceolata.AAC.1